jgi:hypothetical protein
MKKYTLLTISLLLQLIACTPNHNDPVIDYYITAHPTDSFDRINLKFQHTRAYSVDQEGDTAIASVYLDPLDLSFSLTEQDTLIYLGASQIFPDHVVGYDFDFSDLSVEKDEQKITLNKNFRERDFSAVDLPLDFDQRRTVVFSIEVDSSLYKEEGKLGFCPVVNIQERL